VTAQIALPPSVGMQGSEKPRHLHGSRRKECARSQSTFTEEVRALDESPLHRQPSQGTFLTPPVLPVVLIRLNTIPCV
jgi:hypothetical protein